MPYMKDTEAFLGTGEKNSAGQTLEEFLEAYNPKKYDCPSNTVDILIFRTDGPFLSITQPLQLLLVKRGNHPSIGHWATPGGFVNIHENLRDAAARELEEETGVKGLPLAQRMTWGDPRRDPRWRVITTSFVSLVEDDEKVKAGDDASDAAWFDVSVKRISSELHDGNQIDTYEIGLHSAAKHVHLSAEVNRIIHHRGVLRDVSYSIIKKEGIAADHPLLILDAYLYLDRCLQREI